jgi:hypothetical protein
MSYLPPPDLLRDIEKQERREQALEQEQQRMLDQNDEGVFEVPRKRGIADRLRNVFVRGYSSTRSPEADVANQAVWEHERQRRREHERDRSDAGG